MDQKTFSLVLDFTVCAYNLHAAVGVSQRGGGGGGGGVVAMTREEKRKGRECLDGWVQLSLGFTLCTSFRLILQVMDFPLLARG